MNYFYKKNGSVYERSEDAAKVVQKQNKNKNSERGKSSRRIATPKVYIFLSLSKNVASKPEYIQVPKERLIEILVYILGEGSTAKEKSKREDHERKLQHHSLIECLQFSFTQNLNRAQRGILTRVRRLIHFIPDLKRSLNFWV